MRIAGVLQTLGPSVEFDGVAALCRLLQLPAELLPTLAQPIGLRVAVSRRPRRRERDAGAALPPRVGRLLYLDHSGAPPGALLDRKWARARPNSRSYRERGVSREEYAVYLEGYVLARFAAVTPSAGLPAGALALPCELPTPELVRRARAFLAA